MGLFLVPTWPFFLYQSKGNRNHRLTANTLIIANHYSNFDPLFIQMKYFFTPIRFIAIKDTQLKIYSRFITWLFDCIYVDADQITPSFIKTTVQTLKQGGIVCIFPEGVVNPRKFGFFDFKKGYLHIVKRTQSTLLPIYIYPALKLFKKSTLHIGESFKMPEDVNDLDDFNTNVMMLFMNYATLT